MKFAVTAIAIFLIPSIAQCKRDRLSLLNATESARKADDQLTNTPNLTSEETTRLRKEKAGAVDKIESIADSDPKDTETQLEVSRSLASVSEAPRAVPFAERGLRLAEASGDPKLIRDALLTGSEVYYKTGRYDLARERAQRVLKNDPRDKDALALYMQVKDRGAAAATGDAESAGAASGGGSAPGASGAPGQGGSIQAVPGPDAAAPTAAPARREPAVAMTSATSLEARKQIALGWSRIKLDPKAALAHFEAALTADPRGAATRVQSSRARLETGDASGALGDADEAIRLDPGLGEAYAARAEANRALGLAEAGLLADYEAAAKLDGRFAEAYKALRSRGEGAAAGNGSGGEAERDGSSAPDGPRGLLERAPRGWGLLALIGAAAAALGGLAAPLLLKRRSGSDGSPPR